MSILLITQFSPYEMTNGQSLIINNFIKCNDTNILDLLFFGENKIENNFPTELNQIINVKYSIYPLRIRLTKKVFFGNLTNYFFEKDKKYYNNLFSKYDRLVFFLDPYDTLINFFSEIKGSNKILHITDSIYLFEKTKSSSFTKFLKAFVSRYFEKQILNSGFDWFVYVGKKDTLCANSLISNKVNNIICLPQGVDTDVFRFVETKRENKKLRILYSGNFEYTPNIKGAIYILNEILPNLLGDFEIKIVGKGADKIDFKCSNSKLSVMGYVDNIADEYINSDLFLAPLYEGAGLQNKVLQAISCGLVTITTSIVEESLAEMPRGLFIVDDTQKMIRLINDFISWRKNIYDYRSELREFALTNLSWQNRFELISKL